MDFVISKVAMSICALFVASLLGPALLNSQHADTDVELKGVVVRLARLVSAAMIDGLETDAELQLPSTASGTAIRVEVRPFSLTAASGYESVSCRLCTEVHLWIWNGSGLRSYAVEELDHLHSRTSMVSGDIVKVSTRWVPIDSTLTLLAFIQIAQPSHGQSLSAISSTESASVFISSVVL